VRRESPGSEVNHVNHIDDLDLDEGLMPDWMKCLPEALAKAVSDNPFQCALMLRDGTIIEFEGATTPSAGCSHGQYVPRAARKSTGPKPGPKPRAVRPVSNPRLGLPPVIF
jgi:hypothetical protein